MMQSGGTGRETWGSKLGFVLAAAGSAIGLGNIWRFPYVLGENGGFAFLIAYLACVVLVGLPIMGAELAIGRGSGRNPVGAFKALLPGSLWWVVGGVGLLTGVLILSYYSVLAGWTVFYLTQSATGEIIFPTLAGDIVTALTFASTGLHIQFAQHMTESLFTGFVTNSPLVLLFHFIFMILCLLVVSQGVEKGIERYSKILMPTLLGLLFLLIIRSVTLPGSFDGLVFLFKPDFSKLSLDVILLAMGQAFYSLSLGMGVMITYGSYLDRKTNLFASGATVAGLDVGIALLAGVVIFPAVFAVGLEPSSGPGLTYIVLPAVFGKLPAGSLLATLFFLLLTIAAVTSAISLLEVMVSFATDEWKWKRRRATIIMAIVAFVIGVPSAMSFGDWSNATIFGLGFFDLADFLSANILLPVGGILIALFAGWAWGSEKVKAEIRDGNPELKLFPVWIWMVRILAPIAVLIVLMTNII